MYGRAYGKSILLVFGDFACRCQRSVEDVSFLLSSEVAGGAGAEPASAHLGSRFRAAAPGDHYTLIAAQHPQFHLMFDTFPFVKPYIGLRD